MAFAPSGYAMSNRWQYFDDAGHLLGFVVRFDKQADGQASDKQLRPLTFCEGPGGRQEWRCKAFPEPRPLYGLDRLAARPDAPVLVVEGEKAADAAGKLFPDHVAVTSPGGSNAARKADWSPLAGRHVAIWPDADAPGAKYAADVAELATKAGAVSMRIVELPADLPKGWDLADASPTGMDDAELRRVLAKAKPAEARADAWRMPIPISSSLPPVEALSPEMLPDSMRAYVMDVAERQQSAPDFVAVAAICGFAAVVGNKMRIRPKQHDDWTIVPNLWGAIVGRSSAMKSPAMQSALAPVYALQDDMRKNWEAECKGLAVEDILSSLDAKGAKKNAEKALKSGDRDEAKRLLKEFAESDAEGPPCPRLIVNDATVEKLGELLNENPNGLLLIRDELPGFLSRMESEEHQGERAFYLEAFNGDGCFTYDRIGRGTVHIENCTVSIIGGVQPSRIAPIVRGALTGATNDGLIQRLQMTVWPDDVASWEWVDRAPNETARQDFSYIFQFARGLSLGEDGLPRVLHFTPEAQALFKSWMEEVQLEARSGTLAPTLESHILKMPKTVASLALLFALADCDTDAVGEQATLRALAWADYLRSHANRLYAAGQTMAEDGARLLVERRAQLPETFTARSIHKKDWAGLSNRDAVATAIDTLLSTYHCREVPSVAGTAGRPTVAYVWNPHLTEGA